MQNALKGVFLTIKIEIKRKTR